jgi:hypothetical protein
LEALLRGWEEREMITGFYLFVMGGNAFYSPSFEREGEAALFSVEVYVFLGSPTVAIDVEHKNYDDTTWASAGSFSSITTVGVHTKDLSGLKEELRVKYTPTSATNGDGCNMYMPAPAWRPY